MFIFYFLRVRDRYTVKNYQHTRFKENSKFGIAWDAVERKLKHKNIKMTCF